MLAGGMMGWPGAFYQTGSGNDEGLLVERETDSGTESHPNQELAVILLRPTLEPAALRHSSEHYDQKKPVETMSA
jgi:hypothetical protein